MDKRRKLAVIFFTTMLVGTTIFTVVYYNKHVKALRAEADDTVVNGDQFDTIVNQVAKNNQ